MKQDLEKYLNREIVVDTTSSWIYIGVLEAVTGHSVILSEADVHDNVDTPTSKERYVLEGKLMGVRPNRKSVHVNLDHVVSFSLLEDVKEF